MKTLVRDWIVASAGDGVALVCARSGEAFARAPADRAARRGAVRSCSTKARRGAAPRAHQRVQRGAGRRVRALSNGAVRLPKAAEGDVVVLLGERKRQIGENDRAHGRQSASSIPSSPRLKQRYEKLGTQRTTVRRRRSRARRAPSRFSRTARNDAPIASDCRACRRWPPPGSCRSRKTRRRARSDDSEIATPRNCADVLRGPHEEVEADRRDAGSRRPFARPLPRLRRRSRAGRARHCSPE